MKLRRTPEGLIAEAEDGQWISLPRRESWPVTARG